jgi:hypothetical protein
VDDGLLEHLEHIVTKTEFLKVLLGSKWNEGSMQRRDFLTKGTLAAGLATSPGLLKPLLASETSSTRSTTASQQTARASEEIRSAGYLRRAREEAFLPKLPAHTDSHLSGVKIVPMPLDERLRRGIVPRRGFCSITPASDALLISGNGPISIDMPCHPYSEQVSFRHESLFVPRKPFEAPNIAGIFPQVRQMLLDGKYLEAAQLAHDEWHKTPSSPGGGGFGGVPAFSMHLDFPKAAMVKDYLRTVDFESTEVKVHWTDERGQWVRRTFTSRPDNVVVQWLTAPAGQLVNLRIALQRSAQWSMVSGMDWGSHPGIGNTAPDWEAFAPASRPKAPAPKGVEAGKVRQDFNEQRLIYKCILDPSVDNSGYARVVHVARDGGSASMEGDTLVVENASSVMLLTRIAYFPDYSDDKVESLRQAVEALTPDYLALLERHQKVQSEMLNRVTVDFGGAAQYAMSSEELLADQRSRPDYSPALLERFSKWAGIGSSSIAASTPASQPRSTPPSTCKPRVLCRAICGKAWRLTSTGWRPWSRIAGPTPGTSSDFAALRTPCFRIRVSAPISITPATPISEFGPIGSPPEAGTRASSGTITWLPEIRNSSAIESRRFIKTWRCSTRIS